MRLECTSDFKDKGSNTYATTQAACLAIHGTVFSGVERAPEGVFRQEYSQGEVFLQKDDGVIVGFAIATIRFGQAYLWTIAVAPHVQRRGFGKALLREVTWWAQSMNLRSIELTVKTDNPAQKLYFDHGYRVVKFLRRYYLDDGDGMMMRRVL